MSTSVEDLQNMGRDGDDPDPKTIEEMAEDQELPAEIVEGTTGQLSLAVGGRTPDSSVISIAKVERPVSGQFKKGETVELVVLARIDEIKLRDKHDDYGTATHTTRVQVARPLSVRRYTPDEDEVQ